MGFASARMLSLVSQPQGGEAAAPVVGLNVPELVANIVSSLVFVGIGVVVFLLAFLLITKITPFSIRKEIEEDQNTALGIVIGSVIIGLAIIVAAAIH
jgi:putative membrane protein